MNLMCDKMASVIDSIDAMTTVVADKTQVSESIPMGVISEYILPCLSDRSDWNALSLTCKGMKAAMDSSTRWPWPERVRLRKSKGSESITAIAFSPSTANSTSMMACGSDSRIDVFDARKGHHCMSYYHLHGKVRSIAFSPPTKDVGENDMSCKYMVACTSESNPRIWTTKDFYDRKHRFERLGVEIKFGQACETPAIHVAFSPNGEYVLFVSERNEVLSYHIRTGRFCRLSSWGGRRFLSSTVDLHVHPQTGPLLLAAFNGTGIFLKLVRFLQQSEGNGTEGNDEENMRRDRILNIAFSNRGSFNRINDFRLSHCSQHAVAGGVQGYVQLWKNIQIDTAVNNDNSTLPEAIQPTMESIQLHGPSSHVIPVAFSPDGEWVAAAEMAGTIKVWHVPTSSALHVHPKASLCDTSYCKLESAASINVSAESTTLPTLQPTCINTIRFTPDSAMLAATGNDGTIRFWCRQSWTGSSQANQS